MMEYVQGESLVAASRAAARRAGALPLAIVVAIMVGVLHGLHAAHEATDEHGEPLGIVHRDVSPQNVLVGTDGVARVLDFGVAKARGPRPDDARGPAQGQARLHGARAASPEGDRSAHRSVRRFDRHVGSAGGAPNVSAGRHRQCGCAPAAERASDPPSLHAPDIPPALDALILRGLSRKRDDPFASAREMPRLWSWRCLQPGALEVGACAGSLGPRKFGAT